MIITLRRRRSDYEKSDDNKERSYGNKIVVAGK
jgi:hypothetical protein